MCILAIWEKLENCKIGKLGKLADRLLLYVLYNAVWSRNLFDNTTRNALYFSNKVWVGLWLSRSDRMIPRDPFSCRACRYATAALYLEKTEDLPLVHQKPISRTLYRIKEVLSQPPLRVQADLSFRCSGVRSLCAYTHTTHTPHYCVHDVTPTHKSIPSRARSTSISTRQTTQPLEVRINSPKLNETISK